MVLVQNWPFLNLFFRHYRPGKCVLSESFHFLFLLKIRLEMKLV